MEMYKIEGPVWMNGTFELAYIHLLLYITSLILRRHGPTAWPE